MLNIGIKMLIFLRVNRVRSFDTTSVSGPLIFSDQFIEISTATDTGLIYGLGEHRSRLLHNASAMWQRYVMWASDRAPSVSFCSKLVIF